jgi:signal transduction histidine kinase/ActR/RegA family two-component response regulator
MPSVPDSATFHQASPRTASLIVAAAASYALVGGCLTLIGWVFNYPRLSDWNNDGIGMFVNTAICAALGGAAMLLRQFSYPMRHITPVLSVAVALIGGLTFFEHVTGINLGIDTALISRPWGQAAAAAPMRMGPPASVSFVIIGTALLLISSRRQSLRTLASVLGVVVISIASLSLIGYLYGAKRLYTIPHLTAIAMQTATMVFSLGLGLIAAVPTCGIAGIVQREDAGGVLMRRLLLPVLGIPILAGALRLAGQNAGLYDAAFGTAMFVLVMIACFFALLLWTANGLSHADQVRRRQDSALRDAERAQRQLLDSERAARMEAERAARAKDEFLATVSHELRSPLNTISGLAHLLRLEKPDEANNAEVSRSIQAAVRNQARIIDDLLDINRITAGKLHLDLGEVDLSAIIGAAIDGIRAQAEKKSIHLDVKVNPDTGCVMGDAVRLQQLFSNLLSNAVKFTPDRGRIDVTADRTGSDVNIRISDTGQGITPEFLPRVFERFAQADGSIARRHGGLGLGLAIAKCIAELHRGSISVDSAGEGKGTTFCVRLPVAIMEYAPPNAIPLPPAEDLDLTGIRVLVADDDHSAAELLARFLGACGAIVKLANSGADALLAVQEFEPNILLCDISMPDMDGYEVIRRLRGSGSRIPAVAVTAFARREDKVRAVEAGYDMHLSKPVDAHELMTVLEAALLKREQGQETH